MYHMACFLQERINHNIPPRGLSDVEITIFAVFVSSDCKQTPIWHQKLGNAEDPVLWDYHVILVAKGLTESLVNRLCSIRDISEFNDSMTSHDELEKKVTALSDSAVVSETVLSYAFDLDSDLQFPSILERYFRLSFCPEIPISEKHEQQFRVVPVKTFIDHFSSDR